MFQTAVTTQDQALCHLLFHCCLKDGRFSSAEIDMVSGIFVQCGLEHDLNFKQEIQHYRGYATSITNEQEYINYLAGLIMPVNELAVFSWCLELTLSDDTLSGEEEALLEKIADALNISEAERKTITKLMVQRRVVQTEKIC